jgi:hypothetical protein
MATSKKKSSKMDDNLVASKQPWEPQSVCRVFKGPDGKALKSADLKKVMVELAQKKKNYKKGDQCRSRAMIYARLIELGYQKVPRKKKK